MQLIAERERDLGDGQVLLSASDGDPAALVELHHRYHARLSAWLVTRTFDPVLAHDVAQDVLLRCASSALDFDVTRPVWPYLRTMAYNLLVDARRREAREVPVQTLTDEQDCPDDADDIGEAVALGDVLEEAMARLPERQRFAVELRLIRGWSMDESADFLGISEVNLRQILFRARQTLRASLERADVDSPLLELRLRHRSAAATQA